MTEALTFNDYQAGTHKTAAYAEADKEAQRVRAVNLIGEDPVLDLFEAFVAWGKVADGFKKFIRDGKLPKRASATEKWEPQPGVSGLLERYNSQELYVLLGFISEVGELVEKHTLWADGGVGTDKRSMSLQIEKEMGDCFWYLSEMATNWRLQLNEVAQGNLDKLADRAKRDKIHGDGDDR